MTKFPANLPADLPENWRTMETVAPEGEDVGLTPQHGYNYLMKQVNAAQNAVNDAQKAINSITDTLTEVAQQSTSLEILNKIGNPSDSGDNTIFGKQNNLVKLTQREQIFNITSAQTVSTSTPNSPNEFSTTFSIPKNSKFVALAITNDYSNSQNSFDKLSIQIKMWDGNTKTYSCPFSVTASTAYNQKTNTIYLGIAVFDAKIMLLSIPTNFRISTDHNFGRFLDPNFPIKISDVKSVSISGTVNSDAVRNYKISAIYSQ